MVRRYVKRIEQGSIRAEYRRLGGTEGTVKLSKEAKSTVVVDGKAVRVGVGETLVLEEGSHRITVP